MRKGRSVRTQAQLLRGKMMTACRTRQWRKQRADEREVEGTGSGIRLDRQEQMVNIRFGVFLPKKIILAYLLLVLFSLGKLTGLQ